MPVVVSMLSFRRSFGSSCLCMVSAIAIACGTLPHAFAQQPPGNAETDSGGFDLKEYQKAVLAQRQRVRALIAVSEPLLDANADATFTQLARAYRQVLTAGPNLNNANDRKTIQDGLSYRILRASDPGIQQNPQQMLNVLTDIRRDLGSAGSQINNPQNKRRFREEVMQEAMILLKKLMSNNLDARIFSLTVMLDLETVQPSFGQKRIEILDAVPLTYREVLADPEQPDAVRAVAAVQIERYLKKVDALPVEQMDLARAMSKELSRWDTEDTYQLALLDALAAIAQPREIVGKPIPTVFDTFLSIMSDRNRFIYVRCRAAAGVGLAGYDAQFDFDPIAWKVVQLSQDAAIQFNQGPTVPYFQRCGLDLYTAFHPLEGGAQGTGKGMLNRSPRSQVVKDSYEQCLKIAGPMMFTSRAIPNAVLADVKSWIDGNVPTNLNYDGTGNGKPIAK